MERRPPDTTFAHVSTSWRSTIRRRHVGVALLPVAVILLLGPFGDLRQHWLDASIAPLLHYTVLSAIWAAAGFAAAVTGRMPTAAFYTVLFGVLLYLEKLNFGAVTLPGALGLTCLLWLAAVAEVLVTRSLNASGHIAVSRTFSTLYQSILISCPLAILAYNWSVGVTLDADAVFAVLQTNLGEARGYVREYFRPGYLLAWAVVPAVLLASNWRQRVEGPRATVLGVFALGAALSLVIIYTVPSYSMPQLLTLLKDSVRTYRAELLELRTLRAERAAGMRNLVATKHGPGQTFVVVIGESQNRDHMSAYGYFRATTPWLDAATRDSGFLRFDNAYSNHTHTMRVMSLALTEASQYNDKVHHRSASLMDIADQAGFSTSWITNQVTIGGWDNLVTALAEGSDRYIGLNRYFGMTTSTNVHDGETVSVLSSTARQLDAAGNHLIVVHLMGNHLLYCERFPDSFAVFNGSGAFMFGNRAKTRGFDERLNCYDNSILYNDHVVAGLFEAARRIGNLAGFIYVVDHGEAVGSGHAHNSALFEYEMARIPMYAWFSDDYRAASPQRVEYLSRHRAAFFTNDLLYDTLLGIMGIETPHYDPGNDLSSAEYRLTLDLARTLHGRRRIADDPLVAQRLFNSEAGAGRVIAHRVNTLAKLDDAGRAGFDGVEVDLLFRDSAGGHFELGHDEVSRTGGQLEAFLDAAARWRFSKLWLDIKNLESDNYRQALQELERLATRHPWVRDIAIVESSARDAWFARFAEQGWHTSYYLPTEEILGVMRVPDPAARERLAGSIARQVNEQGTAAISFDVRLHAFVQRHLQRRLDPHVVYHVWDLSVLASEPGARRRLEAADYYRDERIRTIIVAIQSAYSI